ncbi:MAG: ATP-binding protein [Ignavibacteria bacterium]|nr:ATP-binding protein [Ignavibacteria bacterium]
MNEWQKRAEDSLKRSLSPVPQEPNELDWKSRLSDDSERLAQHISAFANRENGGFIYFGIENDGTIVGIGKDQSQQTSKQLGNIAREGVEPGVVLDHCIMEIGGKPILAVYVQESLQKPVNVRGRGIQDSYIRSAGQTRKMTKQELAQCIARSPTYRYEEEPATEKLTAEQTLRKIDYVSFFELLDRNLPTGRDGILDALSAEKIVQPTGSQFLITNLGAVLFAKDIEEFDHLKRKAVRVILYEGKDRMRTVKEQSGKRGYASGFEGLIKYINDLLPSNEVIKQALRKQVKMYPELAIRELVANALIHQDFLITGSGPMVEIFSDRIEISNPGHPIISTMRFIDYPPRSRNEILTAFMRRVNICEERGSGIDKVVFQAELFQLPPPAFLGETEDYLKVVLYAHKPFGQMQKEDRIRACYQHSCLRYVSNERMSNQTLRGRFKISDKNYPIASRIIAETIKAGLIKPSDPESSSRKFATYVPFWA